jgi:hypothetical protein
MNRYIESAEPIGLPTGEVFHRDDAHGMLIRRRMLCMLATVLMSGCTDRSVIGPEPGFFGLLPDARLETILPPLPADSCPAFEPSLLPVTRRAIAGSSATIELPTNAVSADFGNDRGTAFRIPGEGLIGVAYDDDLPVRLTYSDGQSRGPLVYNGGYIFWCRVTVDGRPGALFVDIEGRFEPVPTNPPGITYSQFMALATTTPAGRPVNITMEAATVTGVAVPPPDEGERNFAVRRLISRVASLRW